MDIGAHWVHGGESNAVMAALLAYTGTEGITVGGAWNLEGAPVFPHPPQALTAPLPVTPSTLTSTGWGQLGKWACEGYSSMAQTPEIYAAAAAASRAAAAAAVSL